MNRREFCQSTALFLAGSVCAGASLRHEEQTIRFRAQKIFLESWNAKNGREKLKDISRDGCHAVILVPGGRGVSSAEVEKIASEAYRSDLKVFVPTCLTSDLFGTTSAILPLSNESGILQNIDCKPTDHGGFLLLDKGGKLHGLVLYDSSQCHWTGFAAPHVDFRKHCKDSESGSRLMVARWLDRALFS